jgi:hypothetical protein
MATSSFHTILRVRTREQAEILKRAFEEADKREPEPRSDVMERIAEGKRLLEEGFFDGLRNRSP